MPIVAGPVFSATLKEADVVVGGSESGASESGAIDRFAAPGAVFPDGSVTLYVNVDVVPKRPGVGINSRLVSCATVSVLPT